MSCSRANLRIVVMSLADAMSFAGTKCDATSATLFRSQTRATPIFSNERIAGGAVTSFAMARSTLHITISPGLTSSRPAWAARIFSVIVWPITPPPRALAWRGARGG